MGLFSKKPRTEDVSDPAKLLIADHQKAERLFEEIKEADSANTRHGLLRQLDFELSRHTEIEERVLYPFIRQHVPGGDEMMDEAEREHGEAKAWLREVTTLDPDSPDFPSRLRELETLVEHHVKEEESEVFPRLEESVEPAALNQLRGDLERAKLETTPSPNLPDDGAPTGGSRRRGTGSSSSRTTRSKSTGPKNRGAVMVRPRDEGGWEVRRENATRASRVFTSKREAEQFGRGVAKREDVDLRVT